MIIVEISNATQLTIGHVVFSPKSFSTFYKLIGRCLPLCLSSIQSERSIYICLINMCGSRPALNSSVDS